MLNATLSDVRIFVAIYFSLKTKLSNAIEQFDFLWGMIASPPPHVQNSFENTLYPVGLMLDTGQLTVFPLSYWPCSKTILISIPSQEIKCLLKFLKVLICETTLDRILESVKDKNKFAFLLLFTNMLPRQI